MTFRYGEDAATELTREQVQWQLKMYIAALRIADDFGSTRSASSTSRG